MAYCGHRDCRLVYLLQCFASLGRNLIHQPSSSLQKSSPITPGTASPSTGLWETKVGHACDSTRRFLLCARVSIMCNITNLTGAKPSLPDRSDPVYSGRLDRKRTP